MRKLIQMWWVFETQNAPAVIQLGGQNFVFKWLNVACQGWALQEVIKMWPRSVCESPVAGSWRPGGPVGSGGPSLTVWPWAKSSPSRQGLDCNGSWGDRTALLFSIIQSEFLRQSTLLVLSPCSLHTNLEAGNALHSRIRLWH